MTPSTNLRALVVHNFYRSENASGENLSVLDEVTGLRDRGWEVELISADSDAITEAAIPVPHLAIRPVYSSRSVGRVREAIRRFRPHVALVENLFPLHSPWVVRTLRSAGIPVAAGVRSYRMVCVRSTLYRDGAGCRQCLGSRIHLPAVRHGCYQDSPVKAVPMALSLTLHRSTFRSIDAYLAVSDHVRDELVRNGFDADRVVVRPNFVDDPGRTGAAPGSGFLFAGRLTDDKGVREMLDGWRESGIWSDHELLIAGSGPLDELARSAADHAVRPLGLLPHGELMTVVRDTAVTVVPSMWPEPFGRGVIEAAARSRPALVTRSGGLGSLVIDGETGWTADPSASGLAEAFRRAADRTDQLEFGAAARRRYEERFTRSASIGVLDDTLRRLARRGL